MKKFLLLTIAVVILYPLTGEPADNAGAVIKYDANNGFQVNQASKDIGSGVQAPKVVIVNGSGTEVSPVAGSSVTSAPGATPSPSPYMVLNVQGAASGIPAPVANQAYIDATTLIGLRVGSINKDLNAVTITTIATVWTPTSGKKFRLMGGSISVSTACSVLFEDNAAGGGNFVYRTPKLAADTQYTFVVMGGQGKLSATANNVLKATGSADPVVITGTIYGCEE